MFLLLYAVFLMFFWLRAVFWLTSSHYPDISPVALSNFRQRLLTFYGRYAGFFIIIYFLALVNGLVAGYFQRHHDFKLMAASIYILSGLGIILDLGVLVYIVINMFRNIKFFKLMKSVKSSTQNH